MDVEIGATYETQGGVVIEIVGRLWVGQRPFFKGRTPVLLHPVYYTEDGKCFTGPAGWDLALKLW